jgi:hypothetical protein
LTAGVAGASRDGSGRQEGERKGGNIKLTYECVANTRTDRLESATYNAAN